VADNQLLGLFNNVDAAADAIDRLHKLGVSDEKITILSNAPYRPEMLGRPHHHSKVSLASLGGAILGVLLAAFLTVGLFLLYPLYQGGQPLIPIPSSLIIFFEVTMLGTIWASFFSMLVLSGLPAFKVQPYDPRITDGYIGVEATVEAKMGDPVEQACQDAGAVDVKRFPQAPAIDYKFKRFWGGVLGVLTVGAVISGLFFYDVLHIDFPTNMDEQDSFGYEQGPRLAAPENAVPVQGPALINGEPASLPVPSSPDSLQRGKTLFGINCVQCHGAGGIGNGAVGSFFTPGPFDLTSSAVQNLQDNELFVVITQGFGVMPPLAENLSPEERWDVINYVRTLKK
jgi:mono/diheme cytochrome c family protein